MAQSKIRTLRSADATPVTRLHQVLENADRLQSVMIIMHWKPKDGSEDLGNWSTTWSPLTSQELAMCSSIVQNEVMNHLDEQFNPDADSITPTEEGE